MEDCDSRLASTNVVGVNPLPGIQSEKKPRVIVVSVVVAWTIGVNSSTERSLSLLARLVWRAWRLNVAKVRATEGGMVVPLEEARAPGIHSVKVLNVSVANTLGGSGGKKELRRGASARGSASARAGDRYYRISIPT